MRTSVSIQSKPATYGSRLHLLKVTAHGANENAKCLHSALRKIQQCANDMQTEIVQNRRRHARRRRSRPTRAGPSILAEPYREKTCIERKTPAVLRARHLARIGGIEMAGTSEPEEKEEGNEHYGCSRWSLNFSAFRSSVTPGFGLVRIETAEESSRSWGAPKDSMKFSPAISGRIRFDGVWNFRWHAILKC